MGSIRKRVDVALPSLRRTVRHSKPAGMGKTRRLLTFPPSFGSWDTDPDVSGIRPSVIPARLSQSMVPVIRPVVMSGEARRSDFVRRFFLGLAIMSPLK